MGRFEKLGERLDRLAQELRTATHNGIERTTKETREWRKYLDDLAEKIRKTSQEGLERFTTETKEFGQITKLRSQARDRKREFQDKLQRMGEIAFRLKIYEKMEEEELKKLGEEISSLEREIKEKEGQIQKLKRRSDTEAKNS